MLPKVFVPMKTNASTGRLTQHYKCMVGKGIDSKSIIPEPTNNGHRYDATRNKFLYTPATHLTEIKKENQRLLKRLTNIITKTANPPSLNSEENKRRSLSLNGRIRKKELVRITKENREFLKRLMNKKSHYTTKYPINNNRSKTDKTRTSSRALNKTIDTARLSNTAIRFKVDSEVLDSNSSIMMEKCNITNKKLRKMGQEYYLIRVELKSGKLKITANNIRLQNFYVVNYQLEQSIFN